MVDERQVVLVHRVQDELHADEREDGCQAVGEVDEAVQQAVNQEVQLAQAHEGERGRSEHNVDGLGEAEDRGNRVEREEQVGARDCDHDEHHGGHDALAVFDGEELVAVEVFAGLQVFLGEANHDVVGLVVAVALGEFVLEQVTRGHEQDQAEDVEHPGEGVNDCRAGEDEGAARQDGKDDTEEQDLLLILTSDAEGAHNDHEDEEVINRERLFGDVARVEFGGGGGAVRHEDVQAKQHGDADVDTRPDGRFLDGGFVRLTDVNEEIEGQQASDDENSNQPLQPGNFHGEPFLWCAYRTTSLSRRPEWRSARLPG